ncbi:hypothetical protein [Ruegeria sp. HKCCD6428]|uniref:hypothetical protein n=1 Tax=Ruegeria sp. HKCCD6428 TaxID=2683002 RepID=UPI0014929453|nr:hypothetical protein [Ruegeria sp. HKCCD6428]
MYFHLMEMLENEPGEPAIWEQVLRLSQQAEAVEGGMEKWYGVVADEILAEEGIAIDEPTRARLLREVHRSWTQAASQQLKRAEGDFTPDPQATRFPEWEPTASPKVAIEGPTLTSLFERWKKDHLSNGKAPATVDDFAQKKHASVACLPFSVLRFLNITVDPFSWGGSVPACAKLCSALPMNGGNRMQWFSGMAQSDPERILLNTCRSAVTTLGMGCYSSKG